MVSSVVARRKTTVGALARITVVGVGLVVALSALYPIFVPIDPDAFASATGLSWDAFRAANPEVADLMAGEVRLLGISFLAFGLLAAAAAWLIPARGRGVAVQWILPVALAAVTAVLLIEESGSTLVGFYGALALVAVVGVGVLVTRPEGG